MVLGNTSCLFFIVKEALVNSVCHLGTIGYKNTKSKDNAMNMPLLSLITWGQALHNHHINTRKYSLQKLKKELALVLCFTFIEEKSR